MKSIIEKHYLLEEEFFNNVIKKLTDDFKTNDKKIGLIIIAHVLIDAIPFLGALSSKFAINVVFAKPKSVNQRIFDYLSATYNLIIADRENINNISYLSQFVNPDQDGFILIDIGGYFSKISKELKDKFGDKFLGSIEDTENGLLKYISNQIDYPFYQVARSPLKSNEDHLVGQAISFSAESIFRQNGVLLNGQKMGVIGYGKIGCGVANGFKARQSIVLVHDIDPIKVTHAYSHGFIPNDKDNLLNNSDIICFATGSRCLLSSDFSKIKTGAYVFTVTSSDDELDVRWLKDNYSSKEISPIVTQYSKGEHYFYVLNNGNAINFIHGTTVGAFILLVQAEIIACAVALATRNSADNSYSISSKVRQLIADEWLKLFTSKFN